MKYKDIVLEKEVKYLDGKKSEVNYHIEKKIGIYKHTIAVLCEKDFKKLKILIEKTNDV